MESLHKRPFSGGEFRVIFFNEKRIQFPHLFHTGVKFGLMTLQVILSSMNDFRDNRLLEIHALLTHLYIYVYTHTHTHTHIQGVPGGMCQTSGECSLR